MNANETLRSPVSPKRTMFPIFSRRYCNDRFSTECGIGVQEESSSIMSHMNVRQDSSEGLGVQYQENACRYVEVTGHYRSWTPVSCQSRLITRGRVHKRKGQLSSDSLTSIENTR
jgi:hypothetical protein